MDNKEILRELEGFAEQINEAFDQIESLPCLEDLRYELDNAADTIYSVMGNLEADVPYSALESLADEFRVFVDRLKEEGVLAEDDAKKVKITMGSETVMTPAQRAAFAVLTGRKNGA